MTLSKQVLTIEALERLRSSRLGNPRYLVRFTNGVTARTGVNSMAAIGLENSEYRQGPVIVTFDGSGFIVGVKPAP